MKDFDLRTAYAVVSLLYLLLPLGTWAILAGRRNAAVVLWTAGSAAFGIAVLLLGLRGLISDFVSMTLANLLVFGSLLAIWQSLRMEAGSPVPTRRLAFLLCAYVVIFELIRLGLGNVWLRLLYGMSVSLCMFGLVAWQAWQLARTERVGSPYWIAGGLLVLMVAQCLRYAVMFSMESLPISIEVGISPAQPSWSAVLLPLATILTAVMCQIGYLGLYLERSQGERERAIAQRASLEVDRATHQKIADLDRQRSLGEMSASLSEALRQPLAAIRHTVQATRAENARPEPERSLLLAGLDRCIAEVKRASAVIEAIRGYIRPAKFQPVPVDLAVVIRQLLALIGPEADARQVEVRFQLPPTPLWVTGDALLLSQALFHLYRNAIQALQQAPRRQFFVHAIALEDTITVSVCDTGPGMSEDMRQHIGRPFGHAEGHGLGLGLAIATSIVHLHEGRLSASPALGGGLCVDIVLPVRHAAAEPGA